MPLTSSQVTTVKATVPIVQAHGIALCDLFYKNMFAAEPALKPTFSQSNQRSGAQPRALAGALLAYAQNIDNLEVLGPHLERICQKHASLYITPEQYSTVGKYLLEAMAQLLGAEAFTGEVEDAWSAAYWQLADMMITREKQLYSYDSEWISWRRFVVKEKVREAEGLMSLYLAPRDGATLPDFLPGQYVSLNVHVPLLGYKQVRQYSLSGKPNGQTYRVSVKKEEPDDQRDICMAGETVPGMVSNLLHSSVKVGDEIEVSKPRGVFHLDVDAQESPNISLISAGSGITPMVAILETLAERQPKRKVYWTHVTRSSETHAFQDRVADLAVPSNIDKKTVVYTRPSEQDRQGDHFDLAGRATPEALVDHGMKGADLHATDYYICGPATFMNGVSETLKSQGVPATKISMELFGTGGLPEPSG